ncbi:PaaI family thioesterase [Modestobacter sp. SYSU DS0657]
MSIQQRLVPELTCFGCGPANPRGLQLASFPTEDGVVAEFLPWAEHDNGLGFLNGGIIATLLDCSSAAAVLHEADHRGWGALPGAALPYVTAGLDVRYLRPAPLTEPVALTAVVTEADEAAMTVDVALLWDGKPRATGVAHWKRWRPRA